MLQSENEVTTRTRFIDREHGPLLGEELILLGKNDSIVSATTLHASPRVTGIKHQVPPIIFLPRTDTPPATCINHKTLIREGHLSLWSDELRQQFDRRLRREPFVCVSSSPIACPPSFLYGARWFVRQEYSGPGVKTGKWCAQIQRSFTSTSHRLHQVVLPHSGNRNCWGNLCPSHTHTRASNHLWNHTETKKKGVGTLCA